MFALCIESSHARGMGHLFRTLILADALQARGHAVQFLMNDHPPSQQLLQQHGYSPLLVSLTDTQSNWEAAIIRQQQIACWVNDRLNTSAEHALHIKACGIPLVTFDDAGAGATEADLHVAALSVGAQKKPAGAQVLRGHHYLILNPEIEQFRRLRTALNSTLITLGGSDTYGATIAVVRILAQQGKSATIVLGPGFMHHTALKEVLTPAFTVKHGVSSLMAEMAQHDLAITGGGITPFEANAAGLPCIIVANETFEIANAELLAQLGGSVFAGHHTTIDAKLLLHPHPIEAMSRAGMQHLGLQGCSRVISAVEALL